MAVEATAVSISGSPITLAEGKTHLRVDSSADDNYITELIKAATAHAENFQNRSYISRTRTKVLDAFPGSSLKPIRLPYAPLSSVTSIQYVDTAGDTQTWSSSLYDVDTDSEPGRVKPAYSQIYPSTRVEMNAITITYVAGYGAADQVPDEIKHAIKLILGHLYENRETTSTAPLKEIPEGAKALLWPDRVLF